jgi:branched-chain amino acid transport system ATP-binding protein
MTILDIQGVTRTFGGLIALSNINLKVERGDTLGIIGPNGSGKTTLFSVISGIYRPTAGKVIFDGRDITELKAHEIAKAGIARTFQMLRIFQDMSCFENMMVGFHQHIPYGVWTAAFGLPLKHSSERAAKAEVMELLDFIGLADYADMPASEMSIGQQRLLALGRAVAMKPKMLMLDEPAAGLSPLNVDRLLDTVSALQKQFDLTVIVIEHVLKVVMNMCNRVAVLDHGQKIAEGTPAEVKDNHLVIEAYLGKEMDDDQIRAAFQS